MRKVHGCLSQGSVLGMLAEKTICPKGTFTHRSVVPRGSQANLPVLGVLFRQKYLSQWSHRQNLSVLG